VGWDDLVREAENDPILRAALVTYQRAFARVPDDVPIHSMPGVAIQLCPTVDDAVAFCNTGRVITDACERIESQRRAGA
jgi:hypothetical protein